MSYEGELLTQCPNGMYDFSKTYAVLVSGSRFNPYGHMLLNTGGRGGRYFHVSDLYGRPRTMTESQFQRYLSTNSKTIVSVLRVRIPRPKDSQLKLEQVLSNDWAWGAIIHNCETMVEEIVMAGGGRKLRTGSLPLPMEATNSCEGW
ncbi:MAG: hypothetical protein H6972_03815 [Gammaproteobacteria bacterium]|nr:hypothetical protein [Gammaproteobacteria bacterium]